MKRNTFYGLFLLTATLFFTGFGEKEEERPNIIFLLADDLRYNALGCMGNSIVQTPALDALAAEGTLFRNSYVTSPICAISRASIFTGQYANRHNINDFTTGFTAAAREATFPALLKKAGYYTGFIGKYGVGVKAVTADYDDWKGFDGQGVYFYKDEKGQLLHSTDLMAKQAIEFLQQSDRKKPFCLQVSFKAPHVQDGSDIHNGYIYSPAYENLYDGVTIPPPATGDDKFYQAFPASFRTNEKGIENEARVRWGLRFSTPEKYQESVKSYYRLITGMDDAIKRIVAALKTEGLEKNTVIIFSSDNGYSLGDHGLEGKWYAQDVSLRSVNIVYDGRKPEGRVNDEMALNIDLAPTILAYAGLTPPEKMQGKSLKPFADGKRQKWRTDFYYNHLLETAQPNSNVYIPKSEGVIGREYKYARYYNGNHPVDFFFEELYHTKKDTLEIHNLAASPGTKAVKKRLSEKLEEYRQKLK